MKMSGKHGGGGTKRAGAKTCTGGTPEIPCSRQAVGGGTIGRCKAHGGGKRCLAPGCTKSDQGGKRCKAHGGGKRCLTPGCTKSDKGDGHCIVHGGGDRCRTPGCTKSDQGSGHCIAHGGGDRCRTPGCTKSDKGDGHCIAHGGGQRYRYIVDGVDFGPRNGKQHEDALLAALGAEGFQQYAAERADAGHALPWPARPRCWLRAARQASSSTLATARTRATC